MEDRKRITIMGMGYIGLPTAALLASKDFNVAGIDIDSEVVETINKGEIHIVEPTLDEFVKSATENSKLKAYIKPQEADVYMICVPTPFDQNTEIPTPNISYVRNAVESISHLVKSEDIIILESTSPVGTTDMIEEILIKKGIDTSNIYIAYCPERVLPGKIMAELVKNPRVIGGKDKKSTNAVADFYSTFVTGAILKTDCKTAEMCKLVENSFRDLNIAFANELSLICNEQNIDVWNLIDFANYHPRVNILKPGPGVGGHCIAVDPWFLVAKDFKNTKLIRTAREVNDNKPKWVINHIKSAAEKKKIRRVACLGLAFKPDIDDLRESPAVEIADALIKEGFDVGCVEPNISIHDKFNIIDLDNAISNYDLLVILVNHKEFQCDAIKKKIKNKNALDFCGTLSIN